MLGRIEGNRWIRRPDLTPVRTQEHKNYPGLLFTIGVDDTGNTDIMEVMYPEDWSQERIHAAAENRDRILTDEGCPHCRDVGEEIRVLKRKRFTLVEEEFPKPEPTPPPKHEKAPFRILPGPRPIRDWFLHRNRENQFSTQ